MDNDVNSVKDPVSIHGRLIDNLHFADDIDLIEQKCDSLQQVVNNLHEEGRRAGLNVNIGLPKTKTFVFGSTKIEKNVELEGRDVDNVEECVYLGSLQS